ncbi:MAG: hypothetical protein DMF51_03305 [Acidobacteria bacterium]|nr:MAG: hypothetical protein DMF51_03305 [Acidobacteriota bacterium]
MALLRFRFERFVAIVLLVGAILFGLYTWTTLSWTYSTGERAGYVQKFSRRGWICKTWEGDLAMVTIPGTMPEKFLFSVRADPVAETITRTLGKRVALIYDQHKGVPTSCFGDTEYFVTGVRVIDETKAP